MTATSLLCDVCQTVHVIIVFSIIGLQVAGQKLEMLATSLGTHASFCTQGLHGPLHRVCEPIGIAKGTKGGPTDERSRRVRIYF